MRVTSALDEGMKLRSGRRERGRKVLRVNLMPEEGEIV
jgi:hypothetical protein